MDSGLDSLGAVEFRSSLESRLAVALPPTLVSTLLAILLHASVGIHSSWCAGHLCRLLSGMCTSTCCGLPPPILCGFLSARQRLAGTQFQVLWAVLCTLSTRLALMTLPCPCTLHPGV
jgi:hypothetical protein